MRISDWSSDVCSSDLVFDIHGGGLDLVFPHHENEIAQSRCAHGTAEMARLWMHNGYVVVNGEKMSKSLGNFFTVRQLLEEGLREIGRASCRERVCQYV